MPYFIENSDGDFELIEKDFAMEDLSDDIACAYIVSEKISRTATFKREAIGPKKERRFRCADGQLRTKEEMSEADFAFLKDKMAKTRAARGQAAS